MPLSCQALSATGVPGSAPSLLLELGRCLCCMACHSEAGGVSADVAARLGSLCLRNSSCIAQEALKGLLQVTGALLRMLRPCVKGTQHDIREGLGIEVRKGACLACVHKVECAHFALLCMYGRFMVQGFGQGMPLWC